MFIAYQKDDEGKEFIAFAAERREELEQIPCVSFSRIEEVPDSYTMVSGKFLPSDTAKKMQKEREAKEAVAMTEEKTGLTRAVRELVLAENSGVSDYVRQQAQELEALAAPLREVPNV